MSPFIYRSQPYIVFHFCCWVAVFLVSWSLLLSTAFLVPGILTSGDVIMSYFIGAIGTFSIVCALKLSKHSFLAGLFPFSMLALISMAILASGNTPAPSAVFICLVISLASLTGIFIHKIWQSYPGIVRGAQCEILARQMEIRPEIKAHIERIHSSRAVTVFDFAEINDWNTAIKEKEQRIEGKKEAELRAQRLACKKVQGIA